MTRHGRRIKRCGTCVERKVKCDEQQPYCQRCKNAGLTCSGYHSQLKFVDEGTRFASTTACPSQPVSKSATSQRSRLANGRASTKCPRNPRPQIVSLVPQKNTLFFPYTLSKLSPEDLRCGPGLGPGILSELLTGQHSELHQSCVQALAAMYFGRTNRDRNACEQGLRLYSHALTQLRTDISNSNTEMGTLMSIMCLCVYENVVFSQPTAWLLHYDGLGRLMQARGPKPWRTPAERQILQAARYYITLSAGHQRRHCFLDQPQWESTRCLPEGETPDKIDILYDIFAQPPGIIADYDNIRKASVTDPIAVEVLRNRTQSLIDKLHEWYRNMPWVCTTDPTMREHSGIPLPDDPMECVALAISYAMLLCLVQPCEYLGISLFPESSMEATSNIDQNSKNKFLALEICRFANWALRGQASASYALLLVYPLQIAWFCVQNSEEDLRNVRVIMNSVVADSYGFELGRMRHWDETSLDQGRYGFLY